MKIEISKAIDWRIFLVAFSIGMLYIYASDLDRQVMMVYPNPDNYQKLVFKDLVSTCYKLDMKEVNCYENESKIVDTDKETKKRNKKDKPQTIYSMLFSD